MGELAATHRLGRMRRLRMLEDQKAWKREAGFDRIETIAKISERHFFAGFHSEPLQTKLYNSREPHTSEECMLQMRVDVEQLTMEIALSQPAPPPQCDSSPRRLPAVDTESDKPRTPERSPAIGTGSGGPGVLRAKSQSTESEIMFPLQFSVDVFFCVSAAQPRSRSVFCFSQASG